MSIDAPETYLIPICSWRRVQQRPHNRSKISQAVVEGSVIKFLEGQHHLSAITRPPPQVDIHFMSIDATGGYVILACSWHGAQRIRRNRFKIGTAVVEESSIEFRIRRDKRTLSEGWTLCISSNATGMYLILAGREIVEPSNLLVSDRGSKVWLWSIMQV